MSRCILPLAAAVALLLALPALAADRPELGGFDLVIGDTGSAAGDWELSPTRVYAEVAGAGGGYYFSDLASAFFVLRERHGDPIRMQQLLVADYGADGAGQMLDARDAWFFWDSERLARGGLPLVLAFGARSEARAQARSHPGSVLDFPALTRRLRGWCTGARPRAGWRGDFDWGEAQWAAAWNERWDGWAYDRERGWCGPDSRHAPGWRSYSGDPDGAVAAEQRADRARRDELERERERERQQRLEQERREQERLERERAERERLEREQREREEAERNRPDAGADKGTHDPQFGSDRDDKGGQPGGGKSGEEVTPKSDSDTAQPAPPPDKGTNDPQKDS